MEGFDDRYAMSAIDIESMNKIDKYRTMTI